MANRTPDTATPTGSRVALVIGFGSLLAIMAISGGDALRVLPQFQSQDDAIRRQFLTRNRILNDIRSELYLSGTHMRDYLLDPDNNRAESFGRNLSEVRLQMERDLSVYGSQLTKEESDDFASLKSALDGYWETIEPVLDWDVRMRRATGYAFLRDQVVPKRAAMIAIANKIADINEQQLNAGNARASELLTSFHTRLVFTLSLALALGFGMAIYSMRRLLQLEAGAHFRFLEVAEARTQLAQLSASLVEVQEQERRSLSRELHDEIGQSLSAVLVELRNLSGGISRWPEDRVRTHVDEIKGLVEGTVRTIRNMALLLRPSMLDDLGLIPALKWQAREVSKRTSIDITVSTELESEEMPDEYKTCVYRVVQEALHNCSRHSQASTVRVRIQQRPESFLLSIQDDGKGFDVPQSRGMGLLGIEERAARLGGRCYIHSGPDSGTILTVELPMPERSAYFAKDMIASESNSHPIGG
ncbi:MAG: MCP four helix bundle domain-containing protein [Bryobacteraceae bacterium]